MNPTNATQTVVCVVIGLALVGPVSAGELPSGEGGIEATCDVIDAEAFAAVDELDAILPVDLVRGGEIVGRIQTINTQLNHDLIRLGC